MILHSEQSLVVEFETNFSLVEPVIRNRLSEQFNSQLVAINLSLALSKPIITIYDETNLDHITINQFLHLIVNRWKQELQFQQEVLHMKDRIIEEFEGLEMKSQENELVDFLRTQRQSVIELLFKQTEFDQKQMAGNFCKGLTNGFEAETLDKFEEYAFYVLWKPFITALPVGLIKCIEEKLNEKVVFENKAIIKKQINEIELFIKNHFIPVNLETNKFKPAVELKNAIEKLLAERKPISITTGEDYNRHSILKDKRLSISHIKLVMNTQKFLNYYTIFTYEELELVKSTDAPDYETIIKKLPKTLKDVKFRGGHNTNYSKIILENIKNAIKSLGPQIMVTVDMRYHKIEQDKLIALISLIKETECQKTFLIDDFFYKNSRGSDENLEEIAVFLAKCKRLAALSIDCSGHTNNKITDHGMKFIARMLQNSQNISSLQLNFSNRIKYTSNAKNHKNFICGGDNEINDIGAIEVFSALNNLKSLSKLTLDFSNYYYVSSKQPCPYGPWAFIDGGNSLSDNSMIVLADVLRGMSSSIEFKMKVSGKKNTVTQTGCDLVETANQFSKFEFQHELQRQKKSK